MAVTILDIDSNTFSINGITYQKHFMSVVNNDNVQIMNVYDSEVITVIYTNYGQYTIDGGGFASALLLQAALVSVLFRRVDSSVITDHIDLASIGTNTHPLIDAHIADLNIHGGNTAPSVGADQHISGTIVWTGVGLVFKTVDLVYRKNNVLYSSNGFEMTLTTAPSTPTFERKDTFFGDEDGVVGFITGTASATPIKPTVDPTTQVEITFATVDTDGLVPSDFADVIFYDEVGTSGGGESDVTITSNVTLNSTEQASNGTKSIKYLAAGLTDHCYFEWASVREASVLVAVKFKVYLQTSTNNKFWVRLYNTTTSQVGARIIVQNTTFGLNSFLLNTWQEIIIPASYFNLGSGQQYDNILFQNKKNGVTFFLDEVIVQEGNGGNPPASVEILAEDVIVDATGFSGNLSPTDTDVQTALETMDAFVAGAGDMTKAVFDPNTINGDVFDMDNMVEGATTKILTDTERSAIATNSAKDTNVSTNLSEGTTTNTTVDVNSSDGTNATLVAASTLRAGVMTKAKFDEVVVNNAKVSYVEDVEIGFACSDETTDLTVATVATFQMPYAMTLTDIRANVTTAPTGSALIVDVNDGGTSIMTTDKLLIDATETSTETASTPPALTDTALVDDAIITVDIDQIGSVTAGAGLIIYLIGTRT